MDPFIIIAVISGLTALIASVLPHIRYSSCWGVRFWTRRNSGTKSGENTPLTPNSPTN